MTEIKNPIPSRIYNAAVNGHVAGVEDIFDDERNLSQAQINAGFREFEATKGANGGLASLDNSGKVPSSQLPSYVDDVIEGYLYEGTFYKDVLHTISITPEDDKIYVDLTTDVSYRWSGTAYREISNPYIPDNEDLTVEDNKLKLSNKAYAPAQFSGLGRIYLRKNLQSVGGVTKNILTQEMLSAANTIYVIQYDYDLNDSEGENPINIPANCVLEFDGGSLNNGTIVGQSTVIKAGLVKIFDTSLNIDGNWSISGAYPEWFGGDVNKCVTSFHKVIFTGVYEVSETIVCADANSRYSFEFKGGSVLSLSNNFNGTYLIIGEPATYDMYNPSLDYNNLTISGVKESHIDLKGLAGLLRCSSPESESNTLRARRVEITNINVINAWNKLDKDILGCVSISASVRIVNCEFRSPREDDEKDYPFMLAIWATDSILNDLVIITSKIGIHSGDSAIITNVHVWGAPKIAVRITGNCLISNLYGDWAEVGVYYMGSTGDNIVINNYFLIASIDEESSRYYEKCVVLKTKTNNITGYISYVSGKKGLDPIPIVNNDNNAIHIVGVHTLNKGNMKTTKLSNNIYDTNSYYVTKRTADSITWFKFCYLYYSSTKAPQFVYKAGTQVLSKIKLLRNGDYGFYLVVEHEGALPSSFIQCRVDISQGYNNAIIYFGIPTENAHLILDTDDVLYNFYDNFFIFYGEEVDASVVASLEDRPIISNVASSLTKSPHVGYSYYDEILGKPLFTKSISASDRTATYQESDGAIANVARSGTYAQAPTIKENIYEGFMYMINDGNNHFPVYAHFNGNIVEWYKADGTQYTGS